MTQKPEGDTVEELFWIQWEGLMKRLTKDERDLIDQVVKRARRNAFEEAANFARNIKDLE